MCARSANRLVEPHRPALLGIIWGGWPHKTNRPRAPARTYLIRKRTSDVKAATTLPARLTELERVDIDGVRLRAV